ncbi:MAG: hypothetical protein US42_C0009G0026 [Candidatus Magasanikbacteria bacterium GW2011_GWC2_37_14]|uniref:Uncharacterized protein n=1 Tax=Candidatus Magasanikbacteria bacterium GW2011_GWC2_37_14 TaxID=1619046 RepID=A0A0G0JH52_9BACT|nr:MAG: hypothetical protein US42_C0009G0026 [Candidatus Magasanikbacteria bacterium GW2011_GWC2_37_14]
MDYKKINWISILVTSFNLVLYYVFQVQKMMDIILWTFLFFGLIYYFSKIVRKIVDKEKIYILHKKIEKEFMLFFGVLVIVNGLLYFNLDLEKGYSISLVYLLVSLIENFIEKYMYRNEKVRKVVVYSLWISLYLSPVILLAVLFFSLKFNFNAVNSLNGIILVLFGYGAVCLVIYNPKKYLKNKLNKL